MCPVCSFIQWSLIIKTGVADSKPRDSRSPAGLCRSRELGLLDGWGRVITWHE